MRVLLAIDGMEHSDEAVRALCDRDWPAGSVVRVVNVAVAGRPLFRGFGPSDGEIQAHVEATGKALARIADELSETLPGLTVECAVLAGEIHESIRNCAEEWRADLVVVGTADKGDFDRMLTGSVSQDIVRHAVCPVLIARRPAREATAAGEHLNVLVAVDHSVFSSAAIEWALRQKWTRKARLHLFSVIKPAPDVSAVEEIEPAAQYLSAWKHDGDLIADALEKWAVVAEGQLGEGVVTTDLVEGDPVARILDEIESWPADLVVMGCHGRTGLIRMIMGSVSQAVSAQARCSVEVVRGQTSWYHDEVYASIRELLAPEYGPGPGDGRPRAADERPHIPPMGMF